MHRELIHIYGPVSIYSYGVAIAVGLFAIMVLMRRHPIFTRLHLETHFSHIISLSIVAGLLGGRILYTVSEPDGARTITDFLGYWHGGLSILGCIIGISVTLPLYLAWCKIPVLPFLDLAAIHVPLLQGISRIGCFCAGCCYGTVSHLPWAILYSDPESSAPLGVYLHPTQLYSSGIFLLLFCLFYYVAQYRYTKTGQLFCIYIICSSMERFCVDFWRGDRTFFSWQPIGFLSIYQWIALAMIIGGTLLLYIIRRQKKSIPHGIYP